MPAVDAKPLPIKNQAYRLTFPIFKNDGTLITAAAGLDSERSLDGGTFSDCSNEASEIASSSGFYFLDLTSGEMNADTVAVVVKSSTTGAVPVPFVLYPQEAGDIPVNTTYWNGAQVATPDTAGHPKVTMKVGTGAGEINIVSGRVSILSGIRKNQAILNFPFAMTDSTNHNPITGRTVSGSRSIDGGAFNGLAAPNMTEIGNGAYQCDLTAGDLNGDTIILRFTATGSDDLLISIVTEP